MFICTLQSCKEKSDDVISSSETKILAHFTLMSPDSTGVTFSNLAENFKEDYNYNIFRYEYLYNGGGVAAGDVNGDSLPDLYFTATFGSNKLYLNQGHFKFLDVTETSGVGAVIGFKTGTSMADVNGDGRLDIYCSRTGKSGDDYKTDHVFINMGNKMENGIGIPIFEDQSKKLGLEDQSNTNHACFFDYDRDGDLDMFQLNHRVDFEESTNFRLEPGPDGSIRRITTPITPFESNRLYRNDNGHFTDVTQKAGVQSSAYCLSVTPADLNRDGWMDLYVAVDYIEPDQILINNGNGTFTDKAQDYLKHTCLNSMGSDIADINNDGLDDIMVLDMKAEDPVRYKTLINGMQYDRYNLLVQHGYGRQVGRNVLQLNNGNNTFIDIGQYAGVAATDWSWGSLIADFDNDGWKDIFIANGYRRDVANLDYLNYVRDSLHRTGGLNSTRFPDINDILDYLPEEKLSNYLYINNKHAGFDNATKQAGMDQPSYSNGAAFADLDRDGDLDMIVNNVEDPAFIYRNDVVGQHWLQIDVLGSKGNIDGIGSEADLFAGGQHQHQQLMTNKGFFSSTEPIIHFGLGQVQVIDSIIMQWPDGKKEIRKNIRTNQRLIWQQGVGEPYREAIPKETEKIFARHENVPGFMHRENDFVDFKRERLIPYMISFEGPCLTKGDVNGDHLDDFFVGNGNGFSSAIFIQNKNNSFSHIDNPAFQKDSMYEDCGSLIADMDGDGDQDLIVVSGGNAFPLNDALYMSRYYVNDGNGVFTRVNDFPIVRTNAGAVLAFDYDRDKDADLIICGRSSPGAYPASPRSYLLRNDKGKFKDVTHEIFPDLEKAGMITDIQTGDLDGDQNPEIVFAGDLLPVTVYKYDGKKFQNRTESFGLAATTGWWKCITIADMDHDADLDLMVGNIGLNTRMNTSAQYPVTLISNDFDANGSMDPILCFYHEGKLYPYAGRDAIIGQIPRLKKKYVRYTPYASATIQDIFSKDELSRSLTLTTNTFETTYFKNDNKKFKASPLPYQVQFAPVNDMIIEDFNHDGKNDILMAGNFMYSETETGEWDAGNGTLLLQTHDGSFEFIPNRTHGFWAQGEVRELEIITLGNGDRAVLTGNNKGPVEVHLVK